MNNTKKFIAAILILVQPPLLAGQADITVTTLAKDAYKLTLKSKKVLQEGEAQQHLLATASKLCAEKYPQYGKYEFEKLEPLKGQAGNLEESYIFIQELKCVSEQPAQAANKPSRALSAQQQTEIENLIRDLTRVFLENKEQDYAKSYEMLSDEMKSMSDLKGWKKELKDFQKKAGPLIDRDIWKITVYADPPNAPEPGIYVAADYEASYKNMPFVCGYIMWLEQKNGKYKVTREESGNLPEELVSGLSTNQLQQAQIDIGCRQIKEIDEGTQQTPVAEIAPESSASEQGIGYPTVKAALDALRKDPDAKIREQAGWIIVQQAAGKNLALWSFTPASHPAHPAAIKRIIVEKDGALHLEMQALCQAGKEACDRLIEEFKTLNNEMIRKMRDQ